MTDKLSQERRSANMRAVKSHDTAPEIAVRRLAHSLGYRFRLHRSDLPGKPGSCVPRQAGSRLCSWAVSGIRTTANGAH